MYSLNKFQLVITILIIGFTSIVKGQNSNSGTNFWMGFTETFNGNSSDKLLFISSQVGTTGNISIPTAAFNQNFNVPAGGSVTVNVPANQGEVITSEVIENKGILITANDPVNVIAVTTEATRSEASAVFPTDFLGDDYTILGFPGFNSLTPSMFLVVATEDNTQVDITPSANTAGGNNAGVLFSVTLNQGQAYQVQAAGQGGDLTGSVVFSNGKNIAVFSGSGDVAIDVGCSPNDPLYEQVPPKGPTCPMDYTYLVQPYTEHNSTLVRIVAHEDNTTINIDGGAAITLANRGDVIERDFTDTNPHCITSDKELLIGRFMKSSGCSGGGFGAGDPALSFVHAMSQKINTAVVTPYIKTGQINRHFLSVFIPTGTTFSIDGTPSGTFNTVASCPTISYANIAINNNTHVLTASDGFIGHLYAYGSGDESYSHQIGWNPIVISQNPGMDGAIDVCNDDFSTINLFDIITGEDPTGTWTQDSGTGGVFDAMAGTFTPAAGTTTSVFRYTVCDGTFSTATVNIIDCNNCIGDNDNDGICDDIDLDDDNDGILDTVEEAQCNASFSEKVFGPNITLNSGFEAGNVNFTSDNIYDGDCTGAGIGGPDTYFIVANGIDANNCNANFNGLAQEGNRFAIFDFPQTNVVQNFWCQTLPVDANQEYLFSAYFINILRDGTPGGVPIFGFTITDNASGTVVNLGQSDTQIDLSLNSNGWQEAGFNYTTSPTATTVTICLNNVNFGIAGFDAAMDNVRFRTTYCDSDNDGIPNIYDLDSDNDGIYDIIEAGNINVIDANNDGIADGAVDVNGVPVSASGGTTPIDTDGAESPDYIDIDADNDGIQDNIEAQATATYIAPSGTDADQNGVDDAYDMGANPIIPINTDGDAQPDYLDLNSDDDCLDDNIEGYDLDQDGIADILPNGVDSDSDGLDDAYDSIVLSVATSITNSTDGNEVPNSFPDLQNPGNDRDFREEFVTPNPGTDGALTLCDTDASVDLFDSLGGTPDMGGNWTPTLASGTGIFDPAVDPATTYTYTFTSVTPCPNVSADVVVTVNNTPNAGTDGNITVCQTDPSVDLFDSLGGTPDTGGTWTPPLASGTGVFDPNVDPADTYTYTIAGVLPCPDDSAEVVVSINNVPNAGTDGTITLCDTDTPIDLFNSLGGAPDNGGTWTPPLASGTGVFDPNIDTNGTYTYTVTGCTNDDAEVIVNVNAMPNAGIDANVTLCDNDNTIDLFTTLGGTPSIGGTWTPVPASGTGIFDPAIDMPGVYTYTVNGIAPCVPSSAAVTVAVNPAVNAGNDSSLTICTSGAPIDLFGLLGGTPDPGGTWTPALASGTGIFDPAVDTSNTYTYTVTAIAPCMNDTAQIIVNITNSPDAGLDSNIALCNNDNAINLFNSIGGAPNMGGTWTPALTSGSNIFDPSIDPPGTYTYTLDFIGCTPVSSQIVVSINTIGNAGDDGDISICKTDNPIDLFTILNNNPDAGGTWTPALASGNSIFDPTIDTPGTYSYTIAGIAPCLDDIANVVVTIFDDLVLIQPDDIKACDEGNDSVELFDLEQQTALIITNNLDYQVSYHLSQIDADNAANPLISPYTNIANPQTIYSRVVNTITGCFDTSISFNIELEQAVVANNDTYEICDDNVELDGDTSNDTNSFDLTSRNVIILGPTQAPVNFNVSYYLTQNDADNKINPLSSPYNNIINTQTIFARVDNLINSCFATSEVLLRVNPLPNFSLQDSYTICFDENGVLVNNPPITIDTDLNTNSYSFEWLLNGVVVAGETNGSITPLQPGNYTVNVTYNTTNCTSSADTVVIESAPPILTAVQTSITFIEDNTILATAINSSTSINTFFEFSLDGGPWVSNTPNDGTYIFENVSPGQHTITARDINGCGEAQTNILIIDFIPYFTPNGDGFHDTWNILGIENQPDAIIYIFNRYGKLLKQLNPNSNGWNGVYNGEILPSDDYWFTVEYNEPNTNERKTFKSHFTLKR